MAFSVPEPELAEREQAIRPASPEGRGRGQSPDALTGPSLAYLKASKAASTVRAYRIDWADFLDWCGGRDAVALPAAPETVCAYLSALADAGARASTIQRRVSGISQAHQAAGHLPPPTQAWAVRQVLRGIRRTLGVAPRQKQPLLTAQLRRMVQALDRETRAGARDAALLLIGFAGGFRRSELVALEVDDLEETEDGLRLLIRRSKSDQESQGREIGIPWGSHPETCPIRALRAWRDAGGISEGSLWRRVDRHDRVLPGRLQGRAVALIVKRAALRVGADPAGFAGHSLRAGLATSAAAGGAPERAIMRQTGHHSTEMVRRYIRAGTIFEENAAAFVDL